MDTNSKRKRDRKVPDRQKQREKFKKFIGNKVEGQGFADKRKRKVQYDYMKMMQKEKRRERIQLEMNADKSEVGQSQNKSQLREGSRSKTIHKLHPEFRNDRQQKSGPNRYSKVVEEQKAKKEKRLRKKQEHSQVKKHREDALNVYQQKKKETFKQICKKTHKGQPVMKNQIEYLLQKIEKQINQT